MALENKTTTKIKAFKKKNVAVTPFTKYEPCSLMTMDKPFLEAGVRIQMDLHPYPDSTPEK